MINRPADHLHFNAQPHAPVTNTKLRFLQDWYYSAEWPRVAQDWKRHRAAYTEKGIVFDFHIPS